MSRASLQQSMKLLRSFLFLGVASLRLTRGVLKLGALEINRPTESSRG